MNVPPIVSPPGPEAPPVVQETRRNPSGWIVLGILVSLTVFSSLAGSLGTKPPSKRTHDDAQVLLQSVMQSESEQLTATKAAIQENKPSYDRKVSKLDQANSQLMKEPASDRMAAKVSAAAQAELHRKVSTQTLSALLKSKSPVDRIFVEIYGSSRLSQAEANQFVALLPSSPFVYTAAKVHALQLAGDKSAIRRFVPLVSKSSTRVVGLVAILFFFGSLSLWSSVWSRISNGTLNPRGIPMGTITALDADRLAIRAAQIFALYLVLETVVASLPHIEVNLYLRTFLLGGLMFAGVLALQKLEVDGKLISLEMLGVSKHKVWQDVVLGMQGFLLEFPIAILLAALGSAVFSFLPKATHPASEALAKDHSLATVLPVMFLGSVLAPFWEELVFRGLIFPGLKRLMGGMVPAILLSSLLFASMHPQGISIWLSLASVGAASCLLSYQSRSLVPSMVMHCLHNTAVFGIALVIAQP